MYKSSSGSSRLIVQNLSHCSVFSMHVICMSQLSSVYFSFLLPCPQYQLLIISHILQFSWRKYFFFKIIFFYYCPNLSHYKVPVFLACHRHAIRNKPSFAYLETSCLTQELKDSKLNSLSNYRPHPNLLHSSSLSSLHLLSCCRNWSLSMRYPPHSPDSRLYPCPSMELCHKQF